jgi:hypothetical protein
MFLKTTDKMSEYLKEKEQNYSMQDIEENLFALVCEQLNQHFDERFTEPLGLDFDGPFGERFTEPFGERFTEPFGELLDDPLDEMPLIVIRNGVPPPYLGLDLDVCQPDGDLNRLQSS